MQGCLLHRAQLISSCSKELYGQMWCEANVWMELATVLELREAVFRCLGTADHARREQFVQHAWLPLVVHRQLLNSYGDELVATPEPK